MNETKNNLLIKKTFAVLIAFVLVCLCSCNFSNVDNSSNEKTLIVHYLDVGQGDSEFIELPNKQTMLIDSGEYGCGKNIIKYIQDKGYSTIDYLVATHPHSDHIGSMSYIIDNFDIGKIYMPKVSANTKTYENMLNSIANKNLNIISAKNGVVIFKNNDFTIDILGPTKIDSKNLNNCSAVIKITYSNKSFLFTGDAELKEMKLIKDDISANILKVGHHGSSNATNKSLISRIKPDIAVISVGLNNTYNHPSKSTIKLLENKNISIYRTDKDKTIVISWNSKNLEIKTNQISMRE